MQGSTRGIDRASRVLDREPVTISLSHSLQDLHQMQARVLGPSEYHEQRPWSGEGCSAIEMGRHVAYRRTPHSMANRPSSEA
jgi:hypothetical protein